MQLRQLGSWQVSEIGLGAMPMSVEGRPKDPGQSLATIHAALDAGVTLIDTADAYHIWPDEVGHNELVVAAALAAYGDGADQVLVATKGGHYRPGDGSWQVDGRPQHLRAACEASLRRLGVEAIGLYQFHKPDAAVPFEDSIGAMGELVDEGKVRMLGICNVDNDLIDVAVGILGSRLVAVQNQLSPAFRARESTMQHSHDLGLAFLPWAPLGGSEMAAQLGTHFKVFEDVGEELDASAQQVALAWLLAKGPHVIPIPGSSRPATIRASLRAADIRLSDEQLLRLDACQPLDA